MEPPAPASWSDRDRAEWIRPRIDPELSVGYVVPTGFEAYARVLHPVEDQGAGELISWAQVAAETGRTVHALVQWHRLVGRDEYFHRSGGDWDRGEPRIGDLLPEALGPLLRILVGHTTTPDSCWFCLWEGYGWIHPRSGSRHVVSSWTGSGAPPETPVAPSAVPPRLVDAARVELQRDYLLLHGPVESALFLGDQVAPDWFDPQSPNLFWPEDHAWCVGTDIELDSTLVAGSAALVDELLESDELEVWRVGPEDDVHASGDLIN